MQVSDTTAVVLLELDEAGEVECVATAEDGSSVSKIGRASCRERV